MTTRFNFEHPIEVRFRDCDPMQHVNHAVYFSYLEQARFGFWRRLMGTTASRGVGFILARAECDYRAAATIGDPLLVRLRVGAIGRSSFTFEYEIVDGGDGRLFAVAKTVQVMYDYAAGKPVPIPEELRGKLAAAMEETVDSRQSSVDSRESSVDSRESAVDSRESSVDSRESAASPALPVSPARSS